MSTAVSAGMLAAPDGREALLAAGWILASVAAFFTFRGLYLRLRLAVLHPVIWATATMVGLILASGYPRAAFRSETQPMVWLLGPAVVAMAVPIWQKRGLILANWRALAGSVGASLLLSAGTAMALRGWLGADLACAMAVRSVTAPVGLAVAGELGLRLDPVVVATMMSALVGMTAGPFLLARFGAHGDRPDSGVALGCASHALGTARAFELGSTAGAFASVGMGLSAIAYGLVMPLVLSLF